MTSRWPWRRRAQEREELRQAIEELARERSRLADAHAETTRLASLLATVESERARSDVAASSALERAAELQLKLPAVEDQIEQGRRQADESRPGLVDRDSGEADDNLHPVAGHVMVLATSWRTWPPRRPSNLSSSLRYCGG
jgi:hypothetical protein